MCEASKDGAEYPAKWCPKKRGGSETEGAERGDLQAVWLDGENDRDRDDDRRRNQEQDDVSGVGIRLIAGFQPDVCGVVRGVSVSAAESSEHDVRRPLAGVTAICVIVFQEN